MSIAINFHLLRSVIRLHSLTSWLTSYSRMPVDPNRLHLSSFDPGLEVKKSSGILIGLRFFNMQTLILNKKFMQHSLLGLLLFFGLVDYASALNCSSGGNATNVYGYYSNDQCWQTLEELELQLHSTQPSSEIAFSIAKEFDEIGNLSEAPALDYRQFGAASNSSSVLYGVPAQTVTHDYRLYVKGWPPTDSACQVSGCSAGSGCSSVSAETARAQCEFQATWDVANGPYCWTFNSITTNGLLFNQHPIYTQYNNGVNGVTGGAFTFKPGSSQDYSSTSVRISATTGCGTNTQGVNNTSGLYFPLANSASGPSQIKSPNQTTQDKSWSVQKTDNFTCPQDGHPASNPDSTDDACDVSPMVKFSLNEEKFIQHSTPCPSDSDPGGNGDGGYGNPCYPGSGNKEVREKGFQYGEISFNLYYNSLRQTRPFSYIDRNWSHSYAKRLITDWMSGGEETAVQNVLYVQDERAHLELYRADPATPNVYRSTNAVGDILTAYPAVGTTVAAQWKVQHPSGIVDVYDSAGRLYQIIDPDSPQKTLTFAYLGLAINPVTANAYQDTSHFDELFWRLYKVTDGNGRFVTFTYDNSAMHWLTSIIADDGTTTLMTFGYAQVDLIPHSTKYVHRLTSTTQFGATRQYLYNEPGNFFISASGRTVPDGLVGYWLTGIIDEQNNRFATFQYDDWGRVISSWHGLIQAGKVTLTYPDDAHATVTTPLNDLKTFTYPLNEPFRHWTQMTDGNGTRAAQYDPTTRRPTTQTDANGNVTKFEYDAGAFHETARVEAFGKEEQRRIETDWDSGSNRMIAQRIYADPSHDPHELESTTSYTYGPTTGHIKTITKTDPANGNTRTWTYTYCAGNTTGCVINYLQKVDGPRTDVADVTTFAYYTTSLANSYRAGDLYTITNAAGHVTTFQKYNARGQVLQQLDANGVRTDFAYTSRGWLQSRTVLANASGPGAGDATTTLAYDQVGNITQITQPDGTYQVFVYDDAERFTDIYDSAVPLTSPPTSNRIHYTLNAAGKRMIENTINTSNATTRKMFRTFDSVGHLLTVQDSVHRVKTQFTSSDDPTPHSIDGYDPNGNPTLFQDAFATMTNRAYDSLNRLVGQIRDYDSGADAEEDYTYDARGHVLSIEDPDHLYTRFTYDGLGNLTSVVSPDTGTSSFLYDDAGNQTQKTDARHIVTTFTYDALNRLLTINYPTTALNVAHHYDQPNSVTGCAVSYPIGRLTTTTDQSGSTTYCYDQRGNILTKTQPQLTYVSGATPTTAYTYTLANRVATITYPSGAVVGYGRDGNGSVNGVTYKAPGATSATTVIGADGTSYYPFGPLHTLKFGNGRILTKTFDTNYGIDSVSSSAPNGLTLDLTLDVMGRITDANKLLGSSSPYQHYDYDPLNQLFGVDSGATGVNLDGFAYNLTGDRVLETVGSNITHTYAPGTHHLTTYGQIYDANGNMLYTGSVANASLRTGGTFTYNDANRLTSFAADDTRVDVNNMAYFYNAKGERVGKRAQLTGYGENYSVTDFYYYDGFGNLLGEYNVNTIDGIGKSDYIYIGNVPVAVVEGTSLFYIETDHLGTPRQVIQPGATQSSDIVVWKWDYFNDASGRVNAFGANTPELQTIIFNFRYSGQYYDSETGYHYNGYRDYDPTIGRYIESDPVGLGGGISTYAYAYNDPMNLFDSDGRGWHEDGTFTCAPYCIPPGPKLDEYTNQVSNEIAYKMLFLPAASGAAFGTGAVALGAVVDTSFGATVCNNLNAQALRISFGTLALFNHEIDQPTKYDPELWMEIEVKFTEAVEGLGYFLEGEKFTR